MNFKFIKTGLAFLLTTFASVNCWAASGDIACGITQGTSLSFTIDPYVFNGTANYVGKNIPITCLRTGNNLSNVESATVLVQFSNGGSPLGIQNQASGAGLINYDFYTTAANPCAGETNNATNPVSVIVNFPKNATTVTTGSIASPANATVYACVPPPAPAANGPYSDSATASVLSVTPSNNSSTGTVNARNASLTVNIRIPERCALTMPSGALSVNYTALTSGLVTGFKTFSVICGSTLTAATMTLTDNLGNTLINGVAAGLNYTLGLNTVGNSGGGATLGVTPGGLSTTYRINASFAAGQAGSCFNSATCTQSNNTHYVTVTW